MKTGPLASCLAFLLCATLLVSPAQAQDPQPTAENISVDYAFGQYITFQGHIRSPEKISEALLFFHGRGEPATRAIRITILPNGNFTYRYEIAQAPMRAFERVDFWLSFTLQNGSNQTSPAYYFTYADNRFPWQETKSENITIYWYAGDAAFGQELADVTRNGLQQIRTLLGTPPVGDISLYVYASSTDLQSALALSGQAWVAGHASPDLGIGMVSIAPDPAQGIQMDRQIPHELAHLALYQLTGERYLLLPVWLNEGIASAAELSPSPDYAQALTLAAHNSALLPINSLCASFPPDASSRFLAYAQAASFTRALVTQYGISGLNALIRAYGDGLGCEDGFLHGLGIGLTQADQNWRASTLGGNRIGMALLNFSGYLLLFGLILIPLILRRFLP